MDQAAVIEIGQKALFIVLKIVTPVLGAGLLTGLLMAVFQATTQIKEQTLAFVPKILAVLISIGIFGPWMLSTIVEFVNELFQRIPEYIG